MFVSTAHLVPCHLLTPGVAMIRRPAIRRDFHIRVAVVPQCDPREPARPPAQQADTSAADKKSKVP